MKLSGKVTKDRVLRNMYLYSFWILGHLMVHRGQDRDGGGAGVPWWQWGRMGVGAWPPVAHTEREREDQSRSTLLLQQSEALNPKQIGHRWRVLRSHPQLFCNSQRIERLDFHLTWLSNESCFGLPVDWSVVIFTGKKYHYLYMKRKKLNWEYKQSVIDWPGFCIRYFSCYRTESSLECNAR